MEKSLIFEIVKTEGVLAGYSVIELIFDTFGEKYNCCIDEEGVDTTASNTIIKVFMTPDWHNEDLKEVSDLFNKIDDLNNSNKDIKFLVRTDEYGIEIVDFEDYMITDGLKKMIECQRGIIRKLVMTCVMCPEQYEAFDEFGNQVAYFRLRHGSFTVECPDSGCDLVYNTSGIKGDGNFTSDNERTLELMYAIKAVNDYYEHRQHVNCTINENPIGDDDDDFVYNFKDGTDKNEALRNLFYYEKSNLSPGDVLRISRQGQTMSYKNAVIKVLREHRLVRGNMFPEANGSDGLNEEHTERELEFFKTTIDGLGGHIKTINWLFNKSFKDFELIFRDYATKGSNLL